MVEAARAKVAAAAAAATMAGAVAVDEAAGGPMTAEVVKVGKRADALVVAALEEVEGTAEATRALAWSAVASPAEGATAVVAMVATVVVVAAVAEVESAVSLEAVEVAAASRQGRVVGCRGAVLVAVGPVVVTRAVEGRVVAAWGAVTEKVEVTAAAVQAVTKDMKRAAVRVATGQVETVAL